jgi:hypothetical protein
VREVTARFMKAVVAGDGSAACRLLSDAGKRDMSAFPRRYSHPTGRTCEQAVAEIPRRPEIATWRAMSRGQISVEKRNTGLDTRYFWITYEIAGRHRRTVGGAGVTLLGKILLEYPPYPVVDGRR